MSWTSVPATTRSHQRRGDIADDIEFEIRGQELQFLEIELDPGESAIAEAGAMVWKDAQISMNTLFGDGSQASQGLMGKLMGAGKRLLTGESLFTTLFTHEGQGKARVAFGAPVPGTILPLKLSDYGGTLICQKDAFLAGARGVSMGIHFQQRVMTGLFGGEGFIMQKLEGDGWVFVQMGGMVIERELKSGEEIHVDTGCVAALKRRHGHHDGRQCEKHALWGRGRLLRPSSRPGSCLDPVPTLRAPRWTHDGERHGRRPLSRGRIRPRRPRGHPSGQSLSERHQGRLNRPPLLASTRT